MDITYVSREEHMSVNFSKKVNNNKGRHDKYAFAYLNGNLYE